MTHIHFLFARHSSFFHEGREVFFAGGETPDNYPDKPKDAPKQKTPEEQAEFDAQEEAMRAREDAKLITDTQTKALNMVNVELKKWNDAQRAQKPDHADKAFQELPEDERDEIRDTVMQNTGAKVSETGAVTVNKSDIGMNKVAGTIGKMGRQIGKMFDSLRPVLEKLGMKFDNKDKKEGGNKDEKKEKNPEEKNKEEGLKKMKESGLSFMEPGLDDPKAKEFIVKAEGEDNQNIAPHFKFENGKWEMQVGDGVSGANKGWLPSISYSPTMSDGSDWAEGIAWNKLVAELSRGNKNAETEKSTKEVEKKIAETVANVTSDKWERSKDPADPQSYKKGADGRVYTTNGERSGVYTDGKFVEAGVDAGIRDPETAMMYGAVLARGGDQGWVRYGMTQHLYRIDLKNKSLYSSTTVGGNMEYQPGTNTWHYKTFPG